jgi:arylsulfatase
MGRVLLAKYDQIGGPETEPNTPVGWAWATDTPFQWTKQVASHFGGTRNPMVISWPKRITDNGALRSQFLHLIDVAPTVLDVAGIAQPQVVNGAAQKPIEGVSFASTFASAIAPEVRTTQYFEMMGNRAIYKDEWIAATRHGIPWLTAGQTTGFDKDVWELYDLSKDFTEADDVAAKNPEKLKELQAAFDVEARKYIVDRMAGRFDLTNRPNALAGLSSFTYGPGVGYIQESAALNTHNVAFLVTAQLDNDSDNADGVIIAEGGKTSGWALYVKDGLPTFYYNFFEVAGYRAQSTAPLPTGRSTVRFEFTPEEKGYGKPADVKLFVNGQQTATVRVERTVPVGYSGEGLDIGADNISAVSPDYTSPFSFGGKVLGVTLTVQR